MKNAPAIKAITGSFAEHGMKDVVIIVILLSLSFSIVLDAWIPGTEQPVPIITGIKDFPESPNFLNTLSITKATLAMYPISSRIESRANNTNICGKNPRTAPTPAIIPSVTSPTKTSLIPIFARKSATAGVIVSSKNPFTASVAPVPKVEIAI